MTRVLITGVSGFTGRVLAALLSERGFEVFGTGAGVHPNLPGLQDYRAVDLLDASLLESVIADIKPDKVIHLAGVAYVAHGNPAEIYMSNVVGTRTLLQSVVDASCRPSSVVLASSANVYGNSREGALAETTPIQPANDYAVSKASMELVAGLYRERLPITVVRPFNYTGRGQSEKFLIPKIVNHVRRRAAVIELGNLDVWRDFSDVRSVAECYARLIVAPGAVGQTVNICSGRCYSLREIISITSKLSGHDMKVQVNPAYVRENEVRTMVGDPSKLQDIIGAVDTFPIEDTIRWMLEDER